MWRWCQGWHPSEGQDARERRRRSRKPPTDEGITVGTEARHERCRDVTMTFSQATLFDRSGHVWLTVNHDNGLGVIAESVKAGCR